MVDTYLLCSTLFSSFPPPFLLPPPSSPHTHMFTTPLSLSSVIFKTSVTKAMSMHVENGSSFSVYQSFSSQWFLVERRQPFPFLSNKAVHHVILIPYIVQFCLYNRQSLTVYVPSLPASREVQLIIPSPSIFSLQSTHCYTVCIQILCTVVCK